MRQRYAATRDHQSAGGRGRTTRGGEVPERTLEPTSPITFTYDPLDRLLSETTAFGAVSYTYDAAGRRLSLAVSGQAPVTYTYDRNARLRTITQAPLNPVTIDYDPTNRRTLLVLPNGVSTEYQYDLASRLVALVYRNALGPLGDLTYQYDAAGNRISTGGSFARTLVPEAVATSTYDQGNRQLGFGPSTMTYDDNGNLLTRTDSSGTLTYSWDARNRLVSLTGPSVTAAFAYDALRRRVSKTINGVTTTYLYDGSDAVKETSGGTDAGYLRTLGIDEALARTDAADTVHYLGDALGSTVALTNPTGTAATTYTYEPFGKTEASGTPNANAFRFTGREDDGTGLYFYRARYYDPTRSRFVSEDPIGLGGGDVNLFAYVHNAPLSLIDPTGLDAGWVEPPWHPGRKVSTSCNPDDDCPTLERKMAQLKRLIETHSNWDWRVPRPRGGNRHAKEIAERWAEYAKCQKFWLDKCECTSKTPSSIPFPVPLPGRAPQSSLGGSFGFGGGANLGGGLCHGLKPAFCM